MENRGYGCRHIFVVNSVSVYLSSKMSCEDIEDFKKDFGYDILLAEASFDERGLGSKFKYYTNHKQLDKFRDYIKEWLDNHSFPSRFFTLMDEISLHTYDKLSDDEIRTFEDEFEVKCRGYSISCHSKNIEYKFS